MRVLARVSRVGDDDIASRRHLGARGCALVVGFRRRRRRLRARWRPRARAVVDRRYRWRSAPFDATRRISAGRPIEERWRGAGGGGGEPSDAASTSGAGRFRAPNAAKEDARLLTRLPESERPMVTQEFSMRRWPRCRARATTISRRADGEKLARRRRRREGRRGDGMVGDASGGARSAVRRGDRGGDEDPRRDGKVTMKFSAAAMRGRIRETGAGSADAGYGCVEADSIDLSRAMRAGGRRAIACRRV